MSRMRRNRLILLGAALALAAPGCHKRPGSVTPVPGQHLGVVGGEPEPEPARLTPPPEVTKLKPQDVPVGGGPTSSSWNPADMVPDRAALAAHTVYFDFDSSVLKGSEQAKLDAVASVLRTDTAAKLLIEGHCD